MHIIVSMEQSRAAFHVVGGRAWISVQDEHRGKGGRMGISGTDQGQGWKERIYKTMRNAGAGTIAMGIVIGTVGLTVGIISIVTGAILLKRRSEIEF